MSTEDVVQDKNLNGFNHPLTAGIGQFPARENSRKRDAMMTPFPCLFLHDARVQENEALSATNRGKGWENIEFESPFP